MQTIESAKYIIEKLNKRGYEGYLVGGCVRDSLLNIDPNDFDITTNAKPEEVEAIFTITIPTGKEFGTISVGHEGEYYEVTTYRLESEYTDNRRPKVVKFSSCIKEDLMRRDFTINALAMDIEGNVVDYFDGVSDLKNRLIKCVGSPQERFEEDNLRKLRAIRFASQKNFEIELDTFNEIRKNPSLNGVSIERIQSEFSKILLSDKPSVGINLLLNTGLLQLVIPELIPCVGFDQKNHHHNHDVFNHLCVAVDNTDSKLEHRLAALFHDIGKPSTFTVDEEGVGHFLGHEKESYKIAEKILTRMGYSNKIKTHVLDLIMFHMRRPVLNEKAIRRFIHKVDVINIEGLRALFKADAMASNPIFHDQDLKYLSELDAIINKVLTEEQPLTRKDLAINGKDILEMKSSKSIKGKEVGIVLNHLLSLVIDEPNSNNKDELIKESIEFIEERIG